LLLRLARLLRLALVAALGLLAIATTAVAIARSAPIALVARFVAATMLVRRCRLGGTRGLRDQLGQGLFRLRWFAVEEAHQPREESGRGGCGRR